MFSYMSLASGPLILGINSLVIYANLRFIVILARQSQKCKLSTSGKYFHIFFFNNRYRNWLLKT